MQPNTETNRPCMSTPAREDKEKGKLSFPYQGKLLPCNASEHPKQNLEKKAPSRLLMLITNRVLSNHIQSAHSLDELKAIVLNDILG